MLTSLLRSFFARNAAAPSGPKDFSRELARARALQRDRRFDEAARAYVPLIAAAEAAGAGEHSETYVNLLIERGLALLRGGHDPEAQDVLNRAVTLAPQHVPAVLCARFPSLMRRDCGFARSSIPPLASVAPKPAADAAPLHIVYFFMGRPSDSRFASYLALLETSSLAAKTAIPRARPVLVTDHETPIPESLGFEVRRFELEANELMFARIQAFVGYLGQLVQERAQRNLFLCDPDTLVVKDFSAVFDGRFDLAYTYRSYFHEVKLDHEPFVAGATFVDARGNEPTLHFFERILASFDTVAAWPELRNLYPRPIRQWHGDQLVPAGVIGWAAFRDHILSGKTDRLDVEGTTVAFLPSDDYCKPFSDPLSDEELLRPFVLDFKGPRKKHIGNAAARLLSLRERAA